MIVILLCALRGFAQQPNRGGVLLFAVEQRRADRRVRADKGALVTLRAALRLPDRHFQRDPAFLPGGGARRKRPVLHADKRAYRQLVAALAVHRLQNIADEIRHHG